ncbi:MAG TPA: TlpA disulfide reductase family protein [Pirellulales bacterium]|jgi:thiol-disulfide isomerase/thioredoxin|nr:TlpA disulfide reductase family protein [Pirellulales bacterium]
MLALCALPAVCGCDAAAKAPAASAAAKPVELKITDFRGIMDTVASHRGKIVVMDAWSTQCAPCMQEFPKLVALHHKYLEQVACISLSMDYEGLGKPGDQRIKVLEFLAKQHATFDNLLSSEPSDDLYAKFKLPSIPAVFVYDQQGQLAERFDSTRGKPFTYKDVEEKVVKLLGK